MDKQDESKEQEEQLEGSNAIQATKLVLEIAKRIDEISITKLPRELIFKAAIYAAFGFPLDE